MIFNNTGKIIDDLCMVGPPAMQIYLLDGEKPAYLLNLEAKVKAIKRRLKY